jgi:hypothetical protein
MVQAPISKGFIPTIFSRFLISCQQVGLVQPRTAPIVEPKIKVWVIDGFRIVPMTNPKRRDLKRFHEENPFVLDEIRQVWKVGRISVAWLRSSGLFATKQVVRILRTGWAV